MHRVGVRASTAIEGLLLVAACSKETGTGNAAYAPTPPSPSEKPGFTNKVWEVNLSTGVPPGMLYAFLSDGTLVIASAKGKAVLGAWTYTNGKLRMPEDTHEYRVDILSLSNDEFRTRSNNPGGSVEISMVPARSAPLAL